MKLTSVTMIIALGKFTKDESNLFDVIDDNGDKKQMGYIQFFFW